jgi:phage tail P2-like protein
MADQALARGIPQKAIPPGINDERTRVLVAAFNAMASDFDFSGLLMRTGEEIPDEALCCAVHDFSLTEFIGPDGLPAKLVRKLIDDAWPLHEQQGTDAGVKLGQELLGIGVEIEHWWQKEPQGYHDTHTITLNLGDSDAPVIEPLGLEVQQTALKTIEATKRWSQQTDLIWQTRARMDLYVHAVVQDLNQTKILPPITTDLESAMTLGLAASLSVGNVIHIRPKAVTHVQQTMRLNVGGTIASGTVSQLRPWSPGRLRSPALYFAAMMIRPFRSTVIIYPR